MTLRTARRPDPVGFPGDSTSGTPLSLRRPGAPWRRELEGRSASIVGRRIRDAGLKVSGYCRSTYLPAATRAQLLANVEDNRRAIVQAAELEAACFVMVVGGLPEGSKDLADARAQLLEGTGLLLDHARKAGVPQALEPPHPMYCADRSCVSTLEQALDLCDALEPARSGTLGVAVDVYHVWWDPKLPKLISRGGREGAAGRAGGRSSHRARRSRLAE